MRAVEDVEGLMEMAWAFRASRVLMLAHKLDVFTLLSEKPLSSLEIAERCGANPDMTERLLIACCSLGFLRMRGERYENTELSERYLVRGRALFQGAWIDHAADDLWSYWGRGLDEELGGRRVGVEDGTRRFALAMHAIAMSGEAMELAGAVELSDKRLLLDVGGGPGTYSIFLCKRNPRLHAIVFDLPETIEIAREVIREFGMSSRVSTRAGSWDTEDFGQGYDAVLMSNVLHGQDSKAEMKLEKAFNAMEEKGLLIIRDFLLNDDRTGPPEAALFNLMVGAYTAGELKSLVEEAGFTGVRQVKTRRSGHSIILAEKP